MFKVGDIVIGKPGFGYTYTTEYCISEVIGVDSDELEISVLEFLPGHSYPSSCAEAIETGPWVVERASQELYKGDYTIISQQERKFMHHKKRVEERHLKKVAS